MFLLPLGLEATGFACRHISAIFQDFGVTQRHARASRLHTDCQMKIRSFHLPSPAAWAIGALVAGMALLAALDRPGAVVVAGARPVPPAAKSVSAPRLMPAFASNALLATLMDDDEPPRWTDVALQHFCGPVTRVEVDGRPLTPGARVPPVAFHVRWVIDECWPFGFDGPGLSGTAELQVFHDDNGLSAIVDARKLAVHGAADTGLTGPFATSLELAADGVRR